MGYDPHTGFILAAYAIAATVILSMIVAIVGDYRSLKRDLARFAGRGLDRNAE